LFFNSNCNTLLKTLSNKPDLIKAIKDLSAKEPRVILDILAENPDKMISCLTSSFIPSWVEFRNLSIKNISKFEDLLMKKKR